MRTRLIFSPPCISLYSLLDRIRCYLSIKGPQGYLIKGLSKLLVAACAWLHVCVCISDQVGENHSILHLDEEINMSDVVSDEKSS